MISVLSGFLACLQTRLNQEWPGTEIAVTVAVSGFQPPPMPDGLAEPREAMVRVPLAHGSVTVRLTLASRHHERARAFTVEVTVDGGAAPYKERIALDEPDPYANLVAAVFDAIKRHVA